jgi:hypothetical protein
MPTSTTAARSGQAGGSTNEDELRSTAPHMYLRWCGAAAELRTEGVGECAYGLCHFPPDAGEHDARRGGAEGEEGCTTSQVHPRR